ncbi:MAG TPA: ferritin-like domain-containing protein [Solirubrobacterales bacterium]|jgi:hypothetical protein|nr:ferritin-like domain-containing protein [Solirubrobacterales bacterium]
MTTRFEPTPRSAARRLARDPVSRRRFLAMTGGVGAAGALLTACGGDDSTTAAGTAASPDMTAMESQFGAGDLGIVNYALTLEYLEAAFYGDVAKSGLFKGEQLALIESIGKNEEAHVAALTATAKKLGTPAKAPKATFPLDDAKSVLDLAATVENLGAAAYLGQAGNIEDPTILAAALSIHSVEGRHAALLNILTGKQPTPDGAFAQPADMQTVLDEVQPFLA